MFDFAEYDDHEEVVVINDPVSGLRAVLAVHSTVLGPGLGGIRCWSYARDEDALRDALRLSRGMTYKNALAGLDLGGGKSVILGDAATAKTPAALNAFADALNRLDGRYIAAEDVGVGVADIDVMRARTAHVVGASTGVAAAGDPSPFTAEGVFQGMRAAVSHAHGSDDLTGAVVGILGLGAVGWRLAERAFDAGATLLVADIDPSRAARAAREFGAEVLAPEALPFAPMDIYAPCALGGALTMEFVVQAPVSLICGAANNQLATPEIDAALHAAGKLYAPDYLVNAGGVINVAAEASGHYDRADIDARVARIGQVTADVLAEAKRLNKPTGAVADQLALQRITAARQAA